MSSPKCTSLSWRKIARGLVKGSKWLEISKDDTHKRTWWPTIGYRELRKCMWKTSKTLVGGEQRDKDEKITRDN